MEGFILEVYDYEVSKVKSSSVSLLLTLTWSIYVLYEKLTQQIGDWIWKTSSAHSLSGFWRCHVKPVFSGDLLFNVLILGLF